MNVNAIIEIVGLDYNSDQYNNCTPLEALNYIESGYMPMDDWKQDMACSMMKKLYMKASRLHSNETKYMRGRKLFPVKTVMQHYRNQEVEYFAQLQLRENSSIWENLEL